MIIIMNMTGDGCFCSRQMGPGGGDTYSRKHLQSRRRTHTHTHRRPFAEITECEILRLEKAKKDKK